MKKMAVVGAGTMGRGIALVLARAGHDVLLQDINQEYLHNSRLWLDKYLDRRVKKDKMAGNEKEAILNRITTTTELSSLSGAEIVFEAVNEDLELKKKVFSELDRECEEKTILTTNTSALSITAIAAATGRPERVIGVHFFNPVPVMKLVELVKGELTSDGILSEVKKIVTSLGKEPVLVKEAPGFVVNRLLIPMLNEAIFILDQGVAGAEDIDKALKLGANHPMGPLELADLIGLDVCLSIMESLYQEFADPKYRPAPLLRKKVRAGQLGKKSGEGFYSY